MSVSKFLSEIKSKKKISPKIRLYLIDKDKHYFLNDGVIKNGFNSKLVISKNRDSVLSAFSKMAFLFDEIIRLRIVQSSNESDSSELLYLLNLVPINKSRSPSLSISSEEIVEVLSNVVIEENALSILLKFISPVFK